MKKNLMQEYINYSLDTGATYSDLFYEEKVSKVYCLIDNIIDSIRYNYTNGLGIRIANNEEIYYATVNNLTSKNIKDEIDKIKSHINNKKIIKVNLIDKKVKSFKISKPHDSITEKYKKDFLKNINDKIRKLSDKICQVSINLLEEDQMVNIATSKEIYTKEKRVHTRIYITVVVTDGTKKVRHVYSKGASKGYELFDDIDFDAEIKHLVIVALRKLDAKACPGGKMPVVIGPGFGAVIFHEACGHAMEATSVAVNNSVLSNKLNTRVASEKVTIIDDGTIKNEWGSSVIDDEGNDTRKNILIENGILKGYLIDELNSNIMKMNITGSSRRESYHYKPTSRMNNTYLKPGKDKIEDMIKSIKYGLYAVTMGGGCVNPTSGDFNFSIDEAYMIRDGKVCEMVSSASLVGTCLEILSNVEMVSDDLKIDSGLCGSESGWVNVTIGQPTIKVSSITVGGVNS